MKFAADAEIYIDKIDEILLLVMQVNEIFITVEQILT